MVVDMTDDFRLMTDCWFPKALDYALKNQLSPAEVAALTAWINKNVFDAALADPKKRMNVTEAIRRFLPNPPDFSGTPLAPLYDKTGQDEEHAAKLYGNMVCRVGVKRPEIWWCFPQVVGEDRHSRTYVLHSKS
ncbi:MAG TPA: hypothetical protein VLX85_01905 [Stellaceae bacterium]|nr:hypothetical protein [Stellaceae bacterium]